MQEFEIIAEPRTDVGKGASRRLRRGGAVPGILYGADKDAVSILVNHDDLMHHLEHEAFYSHILSLKLAGNTEEVVLRDLQRHPHKPKLLHVDFQRIKAGEKLSMRVPIHILNENTCPGVKDERGIVNSQMTQVEVLCLPKDLPEYIEVDIGSLHVGDAVHLRDLVMPPGVELEVLVSGGGADQAVLLIQAPQAEEEETSDGAEVPADAVPAAAVADSDKEDTEK